jgi:hypothetical protein
MLACPNKNSADWKNLVEELGEREASRAYLTVADGSIPTAKDYVMYNRQSSEERGEIGVNKKQLLLLLGPTMYNKPLAQVAVKELLQNSFDAIKTVQNKAIKSTVVGNAQEQKTNLIREFNKVVSDISVESKKISFNADGDVLSGDPATVKQLVEKRKALQEQINNFTPATQQISSAEPGNVIFDINYDDRTISIKDDGIGMTPDIVKSAFLSIGGTNKDGLSEGERSGGFGLAKVQFLLGSEYVEVASVRDGVKTSIRATNLELYNDDFTIRTEPTTELNGTFVKVKIPESYTTPEGTVRSIDFPGQYSSNPIDRFDILTRPLIGNLNIEANVIKNGRTTKNILPTGKNITKEVLPALLSNVKFSWGEAEVYVGEEKTEDPKHEVLSSGLFQFSKRISFRDYEPIPYNIVINIKPSVGSTAEQYPFNNQREDFKGTVTEDIKSLYAYLRKYAAGEAEKDAADVFKNIRALPKTDPNKILTPEERDKLYKEVEDTVAETKRLREKYKDQNNQPRTSTSIIISGNTVKDATTGNKVEVENEKSYGSSFKADKDINLGTNVVDTSAFKENEPQFHNNTNFDYLEIPGAIEFFSDFGTVVYEMVRFAGRELGYKYSKLKGEDRKFFAGISIDKSYGGVHIRKVIDAIFINPLSFNVDNVEAATGLMTHIIIHEINHTTESGEGANFTTALGQLYGDIYATGKYPYYEGLMRSVYKKHFDTFKILKNEFDKSSTRNLSASFEGNELSTISEGNIPGNVGNVSAGEQTQGRDQRDQADSERSGQTDRTGDVIFSQLTNPVVSESVLPLQEQQEAEIGQNIVRSIADTIAENLGVSYTLVTPAQAAEITAGASNPWKGEKAFYFNGQVYFVDGGFSINNVLHEFAHPLVSAIAELNPTLFNNLYNQVAVTPEGQAVIDQVKTLYPEVAETNEKFREEVIVRGLTQKAQNQINGVKDSVGFSEFIKKMVFALKQMFRKLFGTSINIDKLSTDTTLGELAEMLRGNKFNIPTDIVTESDYVDYLRDISNFTKELEDVEYTGIANSVKRFFDVTTNHIRRIQENKNYTEARKFLVDETGRGQLQELKSTLSNSEIDERLKEIFDELTLRSKTTQSFVHSMLRLQKLSDSILKHVNELAKQGDSKEVIGNIFYYDLLIRNWNKFIDETIDRLADDGLSPNTEFGRVISGIQNTVVQTERKINKIYADNVDEVIFDSLRPLVEGIDQYFGNYLEKLRAANAPQSKIKKVQEQYDSMKLDRTKLRDMITGKMGDTNKYSAFLEAYTNSPDPVVGGFAMFIKNAYNDVDAQAQRNMNDFVRDLNPLLAAAGYSRRNYAELMEKIVTTEKVPYIDENGNFATKEVFSFKDKFNDFTSDSYKLKFDYDAAVASGDQATADKLMQDMRKLRRDYFHQEYVPEYYEREKIYDSEIGREAYKRKQVLLNQISELDAQNYDDTAIDEIAEQKKILWREYSQLASLTDLNGNAKVGRELDIAKIEKDYRKASREFFEWMPVKGLFESNLRRFEQSLIDNRIDPTSQEYKEKRDKWIKNNTVVAYTPEFFEERNQVLMDLKDIMSGLSDQIRNAVDSSAEMEGMLDIATGFRDQDGQVIGTDISAKSKEKIRQLQEAAMEKRNSMAGFSGLTREEMDELSGYFQKIVAREKLLQSERERMDELIERKNTLGVDKFTKAEMQAIYAKLSELQSKEATDYYVEIANNYLAKMGKPLIDNDSASTLLDPSSYVGLFGESSEYEKWFKENHIAKEVFDNKVDDTKIVYERLFIWNRTRPNNPDHFEKVTLSDGEVVMGKPTLSYFYRAVKKEYRTKRQIGVTIDNRGNWLPKTLEEGAVDDRYYNSDYEKLRQEDPAAFAVLEKMKEYHLKFQEGFARESKLYMQIPRYRKPSLETLQATKTGNKFSEWATRVRSFFMKAPDDVQDGLNFKPEQLVYADMFDEEINKVPITGLYALDPEQVSMNIADNMLRYMHSGLKQKKLIELNPMAQALKKASGSPDSAIRDMTKINKWQYQKNGVKSYLSKKGMSVRAKAISNLYEREFEGQTQTGWLSDSPAIQKLINGLLKLSSFGLFSLNILPSAIKNRQSAIIQLQVEASGGRFLNWKSYLRGKPRALNMLGAYSAQLYKTGNKSLDVQMLQIFDPTQEILNTTFGDGSASNMGGQFGRSVASDAASLGFFMAPRKWLEIEASLELFTGMLYHVKVNQTINGQTNEIQYADAFEIVNGQIELKAGIDKEWAPGGKNFNEFKNKVHELSNRLNGTYARMDQSEAQRYAVFRIASFLKRYFTSMLMNRVGKTRPSAALGTVSTGYYRSVVQTAIDFLKYGAGNMNWMSDEQKRNTLKFAADITHQMVMLFILSAVFGYNEGDEERFEKMRQRSGALGDDDFNMGGWLFNHGLVTTLGTLTEVETFGSWSPVALGPDGDIDISILGRNFKQLRSTSKNVLDPRTLYATTIEQPLNTLYHLSQYISDEPGGYYKRDVGPYWFQKQGSPKFIKDAASILGFTGSQIDPVKALKGMEFGRK